MYKSIDGGVTWSSPTDIKSAVGATTTQAAIHEVAGLLVLYARNGLIATSDDAGDTWTVRRAEDASGEGLNGITASGTWRRFFFKGYYYLQLNGAFLIRTVDGLSWEVVTLPSGAQAVYSDADDDFFIVRSMADGTLYYVTSDMETFDLRELPAGATFSTLLELISGELVLNDSMVLERTDFNGRSYDPAIEFPVPTYTPPPGEPSKFIKA